VLERLEHVIKKNYEEKIVSLENDLELRLRVEIHELEERKNSHINKLIELFEQRINKWKEENIQQIKENVNLIKQTHARVKALKEDNEKFIKEAENLKKEISELEEKKKLSEDQIAQLIIV